MDGSRGGGGVKSGANGISRGGILANGVPNEAALIRAAQRKKRVESGFLGREAEVGFHLSFDLPPFWSASKHGIPFRASGEGAFPARRKILELRSRLEDPNSNLTRDERLKMVSSLPPHEQIVALAKGLDRAVDDAPWTGDDPVKFRDDASACVRRAVSALESRMRASLSMIVAQENHKSMSPAWREREYLTMVFQRVDKKRHGRTTGDCDVSMFMRAWGGGDGKAATGEAANGEAATYEAANGEAATGEADDSDGRGAFADRGDDEEDDADDLEVVRDVDDARANGTGDAKSSSLVQPKGSMKKVTVVAPETSGAPRRFKRRPDARFESVRFLDVPETEFGSSRIRITRNAVAAVFCKYGYDKDGYMPYDVFVNALLSSPSRLLGMEKLMDAKERDKHGYDAGDDFSFDGKIVYPKCKKGVFPPSEFDPELVKRSSCAPEAELELEHVYGYAGSKNASGNLFYLATGELVYHAAAVGVVLDKGKQEKGQRCQRFFFGHDGDITCLAVHPNREWVATGQGGGRPLFCVWDGVTMLQLRKVVYPSRSRGIVALGFSHMDDGDHITAVSADEQRAVLVWRWSKGGADAALARATAPAAWSFGPISRVRDGLDFYESRKDVERSNSLLRRAATAAPSKAARAAAPSAGRAADLERQGKRGGFEKTETDVSNAFFELTGDARAGTTGSPVSVYGVTWNPFPGMEEFVTYGAKRVKVWRKRLESNAFGSRETGEPSFVRGWVGESGSRDDGARLADCSFRENRFVNDGTPGGGGYVLPRTPDPEALESREEDDLERRFAEGSGGEPDRPNVSDGTGTRTALERERNQSLNRSMTSLSSFQTHSKSTRESGKRCVSVHPSRVSSPNPSVGTDGSGAARNPATSRSRSGASATGTTSRRTPKPRTNRFKVCGENVVSATYVRRDVLVTGFSDGALGVWKITHVDSNGVEAHPWTSRESSRNVARWRCRLIQRIADAHAPGPRISSPDGTPTHGGVRCLAVRRDGKTLLSGGADGWIHTWRVEDGAVAVAGAPGGKSSRGGSRTASNLVRVQVVLLNRACTDVRAEGSGPNSFRFKSPYPHEPPPAMRSLDCRPVGAPGTGKKRAASRDEGTVPRDFVFGADTCDVWEVAYKDGDEHPTIATRVHGHLADVRAVATHPRDPNVFASAAEADRVFLWNASDLSLTRTSPAGLVSRSVAFSVDPVRCGDAFPGWQPFVMKRQGTSSTYRAEKSRAGHHLCLGGKFGGVAILDGVTLQPLVKLAPGKSAPSSAVDVVKYCGEPRQMLAAGSRDMVVDVYDVSSGYAHLSRFRGHQASITNLDWSVPDPRNENRRAVQSTCASFELLRWDPLTGKQILANPRDWVWETFTCTLGFPVMGIWPRGSDGTDIHALDRAAAGQPFAAASALRVSEKKTSGETRPVVDQKTPVEITVPEGDAGLARAGYVVTADESGKIKLFNYPCVFHDAPYREYKGHASRAACARFTAGDFRVVTAGARDRALLQFITKGVRLDEPPPAYDLPAEETRTWGAIDGGKAMGWIDP